MSRYLGEDFDRFERLAPRTAVRALKALILPGASNMKSPLLEPIRAADATASASIDQTSGGMVQDERTEPVIGLRQNFHVSSAVLDDVGHGRSVAGEGSEPLFGSDCILLLFSPEELGDGDQAIVAELQPVPAHLPSVDVGVVWREDWEVMIEEAGVYEGQIVVGSKVCKPDITVEKFLADVFQHPLLSFDQIIVLSHIIEDLNYVSLLSVDLFEPATQDNAKISGQV